MRVLRQAETFALAMPIQMPGISLNVTDSAPPKDKPVALVYGGAFNPPHEGHVSTLQDAHNVLTQAGYKVGGSIVAPTADKLLAEKQLDPRQRLGLQARANMSRVAFPEEMNGAPVEVHTGPSEEVELATGKPRRTDLANWAQQRYPNHTIINVTGEDATVPGAPEQHPSLYSGEVGSNHEGYNYLTLPRDPEEGMSSSKIRAAEAAGESLPGMTPESERAYREELAKHRASMAYRFGSIQLHRGGNLDTTKSWQGRPNRGWTPKTQYTHHSGWDLQRALNSLGIDEIPFDPKEAKAPKGFRLDAYANYRDKRHRIAISPFAHHPAGQALHEMGHVALGHAETPDHLREAEEILEGQAEHTAGLVARHLDMEPDDYDYEWGDQLVGQSPLTDEHKAHSQAAADRILAAGYDKGRVAEQLTIPGMTTKLYRGVNLDTTHPGMEKVHQILSGGDWDHPELGGHLLDALAGPHTVSEMNGHAYGPEKGMGWHWTADPTQAERFARWPREDTGQGGNLQAVISADWDGRGEDPNRAATGEFDRDTGERIRSFPWEKEHTLLPGTDLNVSGVRIRPYDNDYWNGPADPDQEVDEDHDGPWHEVLSQPSRRLAMPLPEEAHDYPEPPFFDKLPAGEEPRKPYAPNVWFHASHHDIPEGAHILPRGGASSYDSPDSRQHGFYDTPASFGKPYEGRRDWVWLENHPSFAEGWAQNDRKPNIYLVEPHDGPYPWNETAQAGWVANGATVKKKISDNGTIPREYHDLYHEDLKANQKRGAVPHVGPIQAYDPDAYSELPWGQGPEREVDDWSDPDWGIDERKLERRHAS